jgi:hypothetical protein
MYAEVDGECNYADQSFFPLPCMLPKDLAHQPTASSAQFCHCIWYIVLAFCLFSP